MINFINIYALLIVIAGYEYERNGEERRVDDARRDRRQRHDRFALAQRQTQHAYRVDQLTKLVDILGFFQNRQEKLFDLNSLDYLIDKEKKL